MKQNDLDRTKCQTGKQRNKVYRVVSKKNGTRTFRYNKRIIHIHDLKLCTYLKQYFCSSVSNFEVNMSIFTKITAFFYKTYCLSICTVFADNTGPKLFVIRTVICILLI